MRNKKKVEHHKVTRLSVQQQSYQLDTPHSPGTASGGGGGITYMELIYCRELAHVGNGNYTKYHVHMSL